MTGTQVKNLMKRQMCWIGIFGIGGGLFAGVLTSFFIIPEVVRSLGIREKVVVAFHPGIILLTILIAVITLLLGSRKPVKIACAVTPMEALGYRTCLLYTSEYVKRMCSDTDRISDASLFYGKCRSSFGVFRAVRKTMGFHGCLCG